MNNMIWDAVLWLRKKLNKDKEDIIVAVNNIQNLFETSADATASPSDIIAGKTAYNGTVLLTGTMKDRRGTTVTAGAVTQDDEYTYLSVPEEACFNSNSKLRTLNSNIFTLHTGKRIGDGIITTSRKPVLLVAYAPANSALTVTFISKPNKIIGYWLRMEKVSDTSYKITNAVLDGSSVEVEYWWI